MSFAKVTVVIPTYNAEEYISKCIESVLHQNYQQYIILVVNDGSTDGTENIVKKIAESHSDKIVLYTKANEGLSSARNYGIERVKTKYVTFLDSDDYVDVNYLSLLIEAAEKNEADMVCSGQFKVTEDGRILKTISYHPNNGNCLARRLNISGKLYKTEYLNEWNIRFPFGKTYEDNSFNLQSMFLTNKCYFIDYEGYYQVVHEGSITSKTINASMLPLQEWNNCIDKISNNIAEQADRQLFEFTVLSFFTYFLFVRNRKREYLGNTGQNIEKNGKGILTIATEFEKMVNKYFPCAIKNKYASLFQYKELPLQQRIGVKAFTILCRYRLLIPFAKLI